MKAQIQLIITLIIVSAVMFSSLYFISATNARFQTRPLSFIQIEWITLDRELDTLSLLALKTATIQADQKFEELCPEDSVVDSRRLETCRINANTTFYNTANQIVNNWIQLKMKEGYFIYFNSFIAEYKTDINYGYATVAFNVTIYNQLGEYRVFTKNATVYIALSLDATDAEDTNNLNYKKLKDLLKKTNIDEVVFTYTLNITAKITLNSVDMDYIMTPDEVSFVVKKLNKKLKKALSKTDLNTKTASYYMNDGINYVVTGIIVDEDTFKAFKGNTLKQLFKQLQQIPLSVVIDEIPVRAILVVK